MAPGFGRNRNSDSRHDPQYEHTADNRKTGAPIPNFAPLPAYAGTDDLSSVGGDSAYDSQYGGSRTSYFTQKDDASRLRGPSLGYFVGLGTDSNAE
jgi:hypothetical protein